MNYLYVRNGVITSKGNLKNLTEGVENFEVSDEIFENSDKYIYSDGQIILDPDYEAKQLIKANQAKILEIKEELEELDKKSIRAIRANELDKIAEYEAKAKFLRNEASALNAEL